MIPALLAILVPAASPAEGFDAGMAASQVETGKKTDVEDQGGNPAFGLLMAAYQERSVPPVASAAVAKVAGAASQGKALAALRPQVEMSSEGDALPPTPPVTVKDIRALAGVRAQEKDTGIQLAANILDAKTDIPPLPKVDPSSAFSLMSTPIAYTTELEVATVAVGQDIANAAMPAASDPKEAFALLTDLSPMAGGQRLVLSPSPHEEQAPQTADSLPEENAAPGSVAVAEELPDVQVNLPEYPQATDPASATYSDVASGAEDSAEEAVADPVQNDEQAATTGAPLAAMGGPLVELDAAPEPGEDAANPLPASVKVPAKQNELPVAPAPQSQNSGASADQGKQQGANAGGMPQEEFHPVGEKSAPKPEAALKPAVAKSDDFASLLADKVNMQTQTIAPVPAQNHQPMDHTKETPLVKLSQGGAHTPLEEQVSVHIRQAVEDGVDHITLKLNPPALGKLHIQMDVAADGRAQVLVTADNKDTFDMLQRDARGLQQALNDAGVKTDSGSLQFDFRGQSGQGGLASDLSFDQQSQGNNNKSELAADEVAGAEKISSGAGDGSEVASSLHQGETEYTISASEGVDISV